MEVWPSDHSLTNYVGLEWIEADHPCCVMREVSILVGQLHALQEGSAVGWMTK